MVLIDTSIWLEASRRDGDLLAKLALKALVAQNEATFCGTVALEFLGAARVSERSRLQVSLSVIPYVPTSETQWQQAIQLSWKLRERGLSLPWNDIVIASLAIKHDCRVYSLDKHFLAMADARLVRLYQPGYGGTFAPE